MTREHLPGTMNRVLPPIRHSREGRNPGVWKSCTPCQSTITSPFPYNADQVEGTSGAGQPSCAGMQGNECLGKTAVRVSMYREASSPWEEAMERMHVRRGWSATRANSRNTKSRYLHFILRVTEIDERCGHDGRGERSVPPHMPRLKPSSSELATK